ncbi:MAG: hypothetical protein AB1486_08215, partial [Planctomycetota bacterium]
MVLCAVLLSSRSHAQSQDYSNSYWLNAGDYNGQPASLQWNPELAEFGCDLGGHVDFSRWIETGHPYSQVKDQLVQAFFDPDTLAFILESQTDYELPLPQVLGLMTDCTLPGTVYYLGPNDRICWTYGEINGAWTVLEWCPERLPLVDPDERILLIKPATAETGHSQLYVFPQDTGGEPAFTGQPLNPIQQAILGGHYVGVVSSNQGPDFLLVVERIMDFVRYWRTQVEFNRVFTYGGSSEGTCASHVSLLAPKWC